MKIKNLVFVKHDGCEKGFLFEVPLGVELSKNQRVFVDTMRGESMGVTTTGNFYVSPGTLAAIAEGIGAYLPIKFVTGTAEQFFTYKKVTLPTSELPF